MAAIFLPWSGDKTIALTTHSRHRHPMAPIAPQFVPPTAASNLYFNPAALAAAVARTATTREDASPELLDAVQRSIMPMLEVAIVDGSTFGLSPHFRLLIDAERSSLAARVGAGITDLYMNVLGYIWRANASCLSSSLDPHADFIYSGGEAHGHGVVLAEAHGSFARNTSAQHIKRRAQQKYIRQVKPFLGSGSRYGQVVHGYSIAFGAEPENLGAFLSVSETSTGRRRRRQPRSLPPDTQTPGIGSVPTTTALSSHRSNFLLVGAYEVVDWIDWLQSDDSERPESALIDFIRVQYAGRPFLVRSSPLRWLSPRRHWHDDFFDYFDRWHHRASGWLQQPGTADWGVGLFAIEETAGAAFLRNLTNLIQGGAGPRPAMLQLPSIASVGLGFQAGEVSQADDSAYRYALFGDGLALLGEPYRGRLLGRCVWSPTDGLLSD